MGMGTNGLHGVVCAGGQQAGCCTWRCYLSGNGKGSTPSPLVAALGSGRREEVLIRGDGCRAPLTLTSTSAYFFFFFSLIGGLSLSL